MASGQSSPASESAPNRPLSWMARHWDLLALLLLVLASFPVECLSPRMLFLSPGPNLVDDSWLLDTSFKASRDLWFGRDVVFTYGPLFQWLSSAPARWMGLSMGSIFATRTNLPLWCTFLFGYLTLNLLLPEQPAWKRFVLLLLLCVFWAPWEGRTALSILLYAAFVRGWYALRQRTLRPALLGCGAAILCAVAFLYSADTGSYGIAAFLLSLAGVAWEGRREERALWPYASALPAFAMASLILAMVINAIMARPLDFRFWRNSLAILSSYRWIEPTSMTRLGKIHLLVALVMAGVVFLVRGTTAHGRPLSITARSGFLFSAFAFAFIVMQSGLVNGNNCECGTSPAVRRCGCGCSGTTGVNKKCSLESSACGGTIPERRALPCTSSRSASRPTAIRFAPAARWWTSAIRRGRPRAPISFVCASPCVTALGGSCVSRHFSCSRSSGLMEVTIGSHLLLNPMCLRKCGSILGTMLSCRNISTKTKTLGASDRDRRSSICVCW